MRPKIVTIGGGTGQFMLLSGLKKFPVDLTAIVSMADDGGSTGMLRDELGVLPPGDVRQCLVALSESSETLRELFNYRFDTGVLKGHNFGNIFVSALEKITGSFEDAVEVAGKVLAISGGVIPVTTTDVALVCESEGKAVCGEHAISQARISDPSTLRLSPEAVANPKAVEAIGTADLVVIGPGNLYCSIVPNLLIKGIAEAINGSKAKVVFNCNLMTKAGHTDGYSVHDFVTAIERYIGKDRLDFVTYNDHMPTPGQLDRYASIDEHPVDIPVNSEAPGFSATALPLRLLSAKVFTQRPGDPLKRTLVRHDSDALAALIVTNCLGMTARRITALSNEDARYL